MNVGANLLGLDNAATPIGLRAMRELQTLNPETETASNAQILFLVLNASSLTLLPVSINGLGLQELSIAVLFSSFGGVSEHAGLALAVLMRMLYMLASLPGALFLPGLLLRRQQSLQGSNDDKEAG